MKQKLFFFFVTSKRIREEVKIGDFGYKRK